MKTTVLTILVILSLAACNSSSAETPPFPTFHGQGDVVTIIKQHPPYTCKNGYVVAPLVWAYKFMTEGERMFSSLFIKVPGAPGSSQEVLMEYSKEIKEDEVTYNVSHAWIDRDGDYIAEEYFSSKEELLAKYESACHVVNSEIGKPPSDSSNEDVMPHHFENETIHSR